jgi:hypothetical protein
VAFADAARSGGYDVTFTKVKPSDVRCANAMLLIILYIALAPFPAGKMLPY